MSSVDPGNPLAVSVGGTFVQTQMEYTSSVISNFYIEQLNPFITILNTDTTAVPPTPLTTQNVTDALNAINGFNQLMTQGYVDPTTGLPTYMTTGMAQSLNQLLLSLQSVGFPTSTTNVNSLSSAQLQTYLSALQTWRDQSIESPTITNIAAAAQSSALAAKHTLQSLVEVGFVSQGETILANTLSSLQGALSTTQQALQTLTKLQNFTAQYLITNSHSAMQNRTFAGNFQYNVSGGNGGISTVSAYIGNYQTVASAFYDPGILPQLNFDPISNSSESLTVASQLLSIKSALNSEIIALSAETSAGTRSNPNSLYATLKTVYSGITSNFGSPDLNNTGQMISGLLNYFGDNGGIIINTSYNNPGGFLNASLTKVDSTLASYGTSYLYAAKNPTAKGDIQNNLQIAISANENLNDSQKQKIQNYLFIFQEFYTAASAVLSTLTQAITTMAQNMGK